MGIQGIIRPPPEIRAVADKTASFVAKNGREFETRIVNSAKGKTPKFAFLHSSSPFHAYYEDRIVFYSNGGTDGNNSTTTNNNNNIPKRDGDDKNQNNIDNDKSNNNNNNEQKQDEGHDKKNKKDIPKEKIDDDNNVHKPDESLTTSRKAKSIIDPVAKALLFQRAKIKERKDKETQTNESTDGSSSSNHDEQQNQHEDIVPKPIYTTPIPPKNISQCQLEIIKMTAQFVALNGGGNKNNVFMRELTIQEWENPIFGFLQPRHGHYAYFTQLVDIYRRILQRTVLLHERSVSEEKKTLQNVGNASDTSGSSLFMLMQLKKIVGLDTSSEQNDIVMSQLKDEIQSIENMAGNIHHCLDRAAYQAEYDRYVEAKRQEELEKMMNEGADGVLGGSARVDWHDFVIVETIDFPIDEVVDSLPPPPPPLPKEDTKTAAIVIHNNDSDDDDDKEGIKVVPDYQPKVVSSQAKFESESRTHVIDPISKKSIPIADMSEHMRIQLLDPKWAAEKERFLEKQKDSNLVSGNAIAENVTAFTSARGGMFSSVDNTSTQAPTSQARGPEVSGVTHQAGIAPVAPFVNQISQSEIPASHAHERPPIEMPDAKRPRMNINLPEQNISSIPAAQTSTVPQMTNTYGTYQGEPQTLQTTTIDDVTQTKLSESDFANSLDDPTVTLSIIIPNDESNVSWNFIGQTVTISVDVMTKIKTVKQKLQTFLGGMPVNKMQLKSRDLGYLKDASSLALLNIGNHSQPLELVPKVRGGRK